MAAYSGVRFPAEDSELWVPIASWGEPQSCLQMAINVSRYCVAEASVQYGLCVPASCSESELATQLQQLMIAVLMNHSGSRHESDDGGGMVSVTCDWKALTGRTSNSSTTWVCVVVLVLLAVPWLSSLRLSQQPKEGPATAPAPTRPFPFFDGYRVIGISMVCQTY